MSVQSQTGLTLIELLVGLAVSSILLGTAMPALNSLKQRQQLQALAQSVMSDIQQARSEAVLSGASVQLSFSQHPGGSCYLLHTGGAGLCHCQDSGQPSCEAPGQVLKQEWVATTRRLSVRANVQTMSFQARQGSVTSTGSVDIASSGGDTIRHVVSIAGRVRSCSVGGGLAGLPTC
jgi:type IV fimbrial biogenesis protein FimT